MSMLYDFIRRRDGRVVEGARLESAYTGNRIEGSNPSLSVATVSAGNRRKIGLRR